MIPLMASGIAGGLTTSLAAALWFGPGTSVALAPIGGSLAALVAALVIANRRAEAAHDSDYPLFLTTDSQVKALRDVAAQARASSVRSAKDRNGAERAA